MYHSTKSPSGRKGKDVYSIVTEKILDLLDKGEIPWKKPWRGGSAGIPKNAINKKAYRGINTFLLTVTANSKGYDSPYWLTYKQAQSLGGNVKSGEKSSIVVFWKCLEIEKIDETGEKHKDKIPLLRYYNVFNADQCENINLANPEKPKEKPLNFNPIDSCESIIGNFKDCPPIYHDGGGQAYYRHSG